MLASLLMSVLVAAATPTTPPSAPPSPTGVQFPQGALRYSERGHIAMATNLRVKPLDADPVTSARMFLAANGRALGVGDSDVLEVVQRVAAGNVGTVVFRRTVRGLTVLDGHLAVAVTAEGVIHTVTSGGAIPAVGAEFAIDERTAVARAQTRVPGELVTVEKIYARSGARGQERLHPYYIVGVVAQAPYRSHRFAVNGVTGEIGVAPTRLMHATMGKVYRVSPSKPYATTTPPQACILDTTMVNNQPEKKHQTCALPEDVEVLGLKGNGTLTGDPTPHVGRTTIYNCKGSGTYDTTACTQTMKPNAAGNYIPAVLDDYGTNQNDEMSELMAYYQVDRHSRFMDSLDPTFSGLPLIPGFTNAYGATPPLNQVGPFDNAFFDPQKSIMVFGQGSTLDFAYDGEVIYHEMTHAACGAIGKVLMRDDALFPVAGTRGLFIDPLSLNEGNADAFAVMEPGVEDPLLGEFDARGEIKMFGSSIPIGPNGYVRNLGPTSFHTCQGNGTTDNPGRDGEAHDDGEIWGQYVYELAEGLKQLPKGVPAGATYRTPLAPAMFKALQTIIAAPTDQQTFAAFSAAVESQVRAMYGDAAGNYAQCIAQRRDMAGCDGQVVTIYSGEAPFNDQYVKGGWKGFYFSKAEAYQGMVPAGFEGVPAAHQWKISVPPTATSLKVNVCDISPNLFIIPGGTGRLIIQKGKPITLGITGSGMTADWTLPIEGSWAVDFKDCGGLFGGATTTEATLTSTGCTGCTARANDTKETLAGGDWYFLIANTGGGASMANFKATLAGPSIPTRPVVTVPQCEIPWGPDGGVVIPDGGQKPADGGSTLPDAGMLPDGGLPPLTDAGTTPDDGGTVTPTDAGTNPTVDGGPECKDIKCTTPLDPKGCGCGAGGMEGAGLLSLLLVAMRLRTRRRMG